MPGVSRWAGGGSNGGNSANGTSFEPGEFKKYRRGVELWAQAAKISMSNIRIRLGQRGQSNVGAKSAEDPHPSPPLFEPEPQSRRPEYQGRGKEQNNGQMRLPCRSATVVRS
jgi:hypothetical protein